MSSQTAPRNPVGTGACTRKPWCVIGDGHEGACRRTAPETRVPNTHRVQLVEAREERARYGVTHTSRFVYNARRRLSSPTRIVVWSNVGRPNPRNGEHVRYGEYGPLDGGNGQYLDPSNNATDSTTSIYLTPEASAITNNGTNTGTEASGQVYVPGYPEPIREGDTVVLIYPDSTEVECVAKFSHRGNGHGELIPVAPAVEAPRVCRCGQPATENAYGTSCDQWPLCERAAFAEASARVTERNRQSAAAPVWTAGTPDERRHAAVAEFVESVMSAPDDYRYARAWGILAGLVASSTDNVRTRWAREFADQMNEAFANRDR